MMPIFPEKEYCDLPCEQGTFSQALCEKYNVLKTLNNQIDAQLEKKVEGAFNILKITSLLNKLYDKTFNYNKSDFAICTNIVSKCYKENSKAENFEQNFSSCVEENIEYVLFREDFKTYLNEGHCTDNLSYCLADNLYEINLGFSNIHAMLSNMGSSLCYNFINNDEIIS
ncbi:hypothetical protein NF27_HQ00220 [Candidatus Jidaibacter acanthamoeba]|uniref:Uncharacterized protein n=2 Tax=Candidatus Jidaibacter acanthamoebae TaxID=86105 RepID=A0A0C1QG09_9RICK|nr:hypothetical protein NF27_HQ00220 [Candidatus Jidaibacter acanthamoeba]